MCNFTIYILKVIEKIHTYMYHSMEKNVLLYKWRSFIFTVEHTDTSEMILLAYK